MLLFVGSALASTTVGNQAWPCTRLNWGWRNVWSTCSINSYVPTNVDTGDHLPASYRRLPVDTARGPATAVDVEGKFAPLGSHAAAVQIPQLVCSAMDNTNGGTHANFARLRNRCRRAIDAYGGLVRVCSMTTAQGAIRGPVANSIYGNFAPQGDQAPHATNVATLAALAHKCSTDQAPHVWATPATTCPGLLGWWGVVWNACGFRTYGPALANQPHEGLATPLITPLGGELTPRFYFGTGATLGTAPNDATAPGFMFCSPVGHNTQTLAPSGWNVRGPNFRSTRCRRALDQFGRTARRCGGTAPNQAVAASATRGSADPLRHLMLGAGTNAPNSLGALAPLCN